MSRRIQAKLHQEHLCSVVHIHTEQLQQNSYNANQQIKSQPITVYKEYNTLVDPLRLYENLCQVHDAIIVIKTRPEDVTHVPKHIALDSNSVCWKTVLC